MLTTQDQFFENHNARNISKGISLHKVSPSVQSTMLSLLKSHPFFANRSEEDCRRIAAQIEGYVFTYEEMAEALAEDISYAADCYFDTLQNQMDDASLHRTLREVAFGLDIFRDRTLAIQSQRYTDARVLFESTDSPYQHFSTEELKTDIRKKLNSFHLSAAEMERLLQALQKGNSPAAAAAAKGKENHDLKCISALELYMNHADEITAECAAYIACTTIEMEAIADAVHKGMMTEKVASVLIWLAILAGILVIAYYFPPFLEMHYTIGEMGLTSPTNILGNIMEADAAVLKHKMLLGIGGLSLGIKLLKSLPERLTKLSPAESDITPVIEGFQSVIAYEKAKEDNETLMQELIPNEQSSLLQELQALLSPTLQSH